MENNLHRHNQNKLNEISKPTKIKNWLSSQFQQYIRVWRILRRPTSEEFKMISKVSAIGLLIIGAIGFVISIFVNLFFS